MPFNIIGWLEFVSPLKTKENTAESSVFPLNDPSQHIVGSVDWNTISPTGSGSSNMGGHFLVSGSTTNYGIQVDVTGAATTNYGAHLDVSGGTTNYALYVQNGETKITDAGASVPTRSLDGSLGTSTNGGNRIYYRTGSTNYYVNSDGSGDYSEYFKNSDGSLEIGEIVSIDPNDHNAVRKANYKYYDDERMMGIVSKFGTRNNDDQEGQRMYDNSFVNVGLLGQVQLKVSTENGNIAPGDALTLSRTQPGYAMKATGECRIIGYSMTHYPYVKGETTYPTHTGSKGEIENLKAAHVMVFVDPGYWKPRVARTTSEAITVEK